MTFRAKHFALMVPLLLTGCIFHKKQTQPVQTLAPPPSNAPKPEPVHPDLSASDTTIPTKPIDAEADDSLHAKPISHHRRTSTNPPQQTASTPPATPDPPAVSAIGELSTGAPSDLRHSVEESM